MLKTFVRTALCAAVGVTFTGCVAATPESNISAETATPSPTPTPAPSTQAATPLPSPASPEIPTVNQIASVIAQHEADWREVIDDAGECRFLTSTGSAETEPAEILMATTCLLREATLTLSANTVVDELAGNGAPDEIGKLTDDTIRTLYLIAEAGVNDHCDPFEPFDTSQACNEALGMAFSSYNELEKLLDGWGVYIR